MDRYLIRGFIDGLLSTLGVVIGASTVIGSSGNIEASHVIIAAGFGGGIANGLSNILGAFVGEKAALYERFEEVEKAMLKEEALRGTKMDERIQSKIISSGIADGLATMGGAAIPIAPFLFVLQSTFSAIVSLYISIAISLVFFFILGVYIGRISKENILVSGLKLTAFGGITAVVASLLKVIF